MKKLIAVLLSLVILLCVVITANAVNYGRNAETVQPTTPATKNPEPTEPASTVSKPKRASPIKITAKTKTVKAKKLKSSTGTKK